jgi:signal transduction histidine kinase
VKFTPEDGRVTVTTASHTSGGQIWGEVRVSDTGPGIPENELAAVFAPYYRTTNAARVPGVGLGLAISQALITQMGGTLDVESTIDAGATFFARLPVFEVRKASVVH